MAYTRGEAKTRIFTDLLDDPDKVRWDDASADRAIKPAISRCMNVYIAAGGDRFRTIQEVIMGPVLAGLGYPAGSFPWDLWWGVDNTEYAGGVQHVSFVHSSGIEEPLKAIRPQDARVKYTGTGTIKLQHMGLFAVGTLDAHFLLANPGTVPMNTWDAFDDWVCVTVALDMESREREKPSRRLEHQEARLRESVLGQINSPATARFPGKTGFHRSMYYAIAGAVDLSLPGLPRSRYAQLYIL